ncbi:type II toxin-antitoxin system HicA family toxin [Bradyrhizobium japonicum]|uniref:type II toxin-antitoxin system HicA family toxin n=1 Tax=Bradyrhizobium japonicum TaxID=375 RepID=UPI00200F3C4A|nr:type II toxin-antitoxin system HicA family toxin [Bradyrhizobium japonicum]UQD96118.1 type II toxin-antitoxin system HicA family toxin [Bradyrhizobium japonicum]
MSQIDKLKDSFGDCRGTYRYRDFERLITAMGFAQLRAGKTGGSRRKFMHGMTKSMIFLDEPHDGEMRPAMVRRLQEQLENLGLL